MGLPFVLDDGSGVELREVGPGVGPWREVEVAVDEFRRGERGRLVVYVPVAEPPRSGRVEPLVIPPTDLAVTVHRGAHTDIDVTYGALGMWVDQHALTIAGPVHESYLVGPRDTPDEAAWETEIGWPISAA